MISRTVCLVVLSLTATGAAVTADQEPATPQPTVAQQLKRLSLEELADLDVTSVSRRVERLSQAAAAVSVLTQEDIRRTGVTSLAEAMRLADGIDVAHSDGRTWNVTARGFNVVTANKLLVLMDGRTLYSPLFAGTYWDVQDTVLADVDRIEVIRGPGGTVWGANAMNGVINIISKDASQTRGSAALVAAGTGNDVITSARYGAGFGADGSYRVYGKFRRFGPNRFANGESADDALQLGQLGVRMDSSPQRATQWSLQAKMYLGTEGLFDRDDTDVSGGFAQGRWSRRFDPRSEFQVRAVYDRTYRKVPLQFEEGRHTADVDAQQRFVLGSRHDLIAGGQLRVTGGTAIGTAGFFFEPERRTNNVRSAFVQDEITLAPGRWFLTVGSKFEGNDYTGVEIQPTARLRWRGGEQQTVWGAVSRAVRLPTRFDTDLRIRNAAGTVVVRGNDDFAAESVVAYEGGYRVRAQSRMLLDVAGFVNRYDNLRSQEFPSPFGLVVLLGNTLNATTSGLETGGTVQVSDRWRVHASYTYLRKEFSADANGRDTSRGANEGLDPSFYLTARSYLDLPRGLALDGSFRHVGKRAALVPAYSSLDVRLGWAARAGWELSVVGQNLLDARHPEFGAPGPRRYEFERNVHVRSVWYF